MSLTPWKKLSVEVLHENPYWKYCKGKFVAPNGKEIDYYYCDTGGAVTIIGVTHEGKIPWVNQYRPLEDRESLELPMGGKAGQEPRTAAEREFAEEAQMRAEHWQHVGCHVACNGILTEDNDIYVAWGLTPIMHEMDETEEFEHALLTPEEVDLAIAEGRITDGMSVAAWCQAKPKVLELVDQLRTNR